jgi:hypothetical protein
MPTTRVMLGVVTAAERQESQANVIHAVEQTTDGTTILNTGTVNLLRATPGRAVGDVGSVREIRLSPTERDELLDLLVAHRDGGQS